MKSLLEEPGVIEIAKAHRIMPSQVLLRHGIQRGIVVIAKSANPDRINLNFDVISDDNIT